MDRRPEIYFEAWQSNNYEALQPEHGRLQRLWSNYEDFSLLEELVTPETIQQFYQARVLQASNRGVLPSHTRPKLFNDPFNFDPASIGDIWILQFWTDAAIEQFKGRFRFWMDEVAHAASSVGGDDAYYDYYPDNWMVALQIARALGMKEDFEKYRSIAYELCYKDDTKDVLPEWSEG